MDADYSGYHLFLRLPLDQPVVFRNTHKLPLAALFTFLGGGVVRRHLSICGNALTTRKVYRHSRCSHSVHGIGLYSYCPRHRCVTLGVFFSGHSA